MGYRNPSYDEEDEGIAQFEWDGDRQQWHFRRKGKSAPVLVTEQEKERCEAIQSKGKLIVFMLFCAVFVFGPDWFEPLYATNDADDLAQLTAFGVALVTLFLGNSAVDRIAIRPFHARQPVGPVRSVANESQEMSSQKNWPASLWMLLLCGLMVLTHLPPTGLADWIWLGLAALLAAVVLASLLPSRKPRQL